MKPKRRQNEFKEEKERKRLQKKGVEGVSKTQERKRYLL